MYALKTMTEGNEAVWPRLVRETAVEGVYHAGPTLDAAAEDVATDGARSPGVAAAGEEEVSRARPAIDPAAGPETEADVDPDDELFLLGEACAEAYMEAEALHYRAMRLLAEFHHKEGWKNTGFSSTAEWLAWRIGIKAGAARERVRTALALEALPETSEAMRNGELSFTKVRALTRVATPETESTLLEFARAGSAASLERLVRGWRTLDRTDEVTAEEVRHRTREFSAFVDDDGMVVLKGRLDPEVGAVLMRAVEAASDALFRKRDGEDPSTPRPGSAEAELDQTTPAQRRADALGLLAERALAAGFDEGATSGSRAERYQVMLHVDAETLKEDGEPGISELEDGTRVSAEPSGKGGDRKPG